MAPPKQRILIVEADQSLREFLSRILETHGFDVTTAAHGLEGLTRFEPQPPDLVLLDLVLPGLDGFEVCRRIRRRSVIPILILAEQDETADKVAALEAGADDCLTKPFSAEELLARVRAALRRSQWREQPSESGTLYLGELEINFQAHHFRRSGEEVPLSRTEWLLLEVLARHVGKVVTHRLLHQHLWGDTYSEGSTNLRTNIGRLRHKIEADPENPRYLITEPGVGYIFAPDEIKSQPREIPSLPKATSPASQLPEPPNAFIGRETEMTAIQDLLRRAEVRLLTLTGPGGTGKTRLALQVAARLRAEFQDGVFFVGLAPLTDPGLVGPTIAQTLGIKEMAGRSLLENLKAHLADKQTLIVLDNFEQVTGATPLVSELLTAPRLKLLVTSRAVLHVYGEQEFSVPPMAAPNPNSLPNLETLAALPAIALFIERARAVRPDFHLTPENAPALAELCARLDGLPLAIELAAARIKLLSPQAIIARLSNRFTLLADGAHNLPARQQTLRNALDWSYDLLEEAEKKLFARLSVFAGTCALEAVEAVCADKAQGARPKAQGLESLHLESLSLEPLLTSLLDKSMLQSELFERAEEVRFSMLETIRAYARERLEASGESTLIWQRCLAYYLNLVESAQLAGPEQRAGLDRLEREHDNLRAALGWALAQEPETETALRLVIALGNFWRLRGYLSEGRRWLAAALTKTNTLPPALRARAFQEAGWLAVAQGDYEPAKDFLERSTALYEAAGEQPANTGPLKDLLGLIVVVEGDYERAQALQEERLAHYRKQDDQERVADALNLLGLIVLKQRNYERAIALQEESLALYRALGLKEGIASSLLNLGHTLRLGGNYDRAATLYQESLALFSELEIKWGIAHTLLNMGNIACFQGDYNRAQALHAQALDKFRTLGDRQGIAFCLEGLASVAGGQGQALRAARLWGAAEGLREVIGSPLPPADQGKYEQDIAAARAQVNEAEFASAWTSGRTLAMEPAIELALRTVDDRRRNSL